MQNSSIISKITGKYIEENLESSRMIDYTQLSGERGYKAVLYKDLPNTEIHGYPVASDVVLPDGKCCSLDDLEKIPDEIKKQSQLRYHYLPNFHELYVGTTGSGKTTGCIEPQLRAISSQKNKPSLFLTDPKGELFDRNVKHLKDNGYKIFVLNFKDVMHSDSWNFLYDLYDTKMKIKDIGKNALARTGEVKAGLKMFGEKSDFSSVAYIEYCGYAFPDGQSFNNYITFEKDRLESYIDDQLNQLVHMMIEVQGKMDKSWEYGAQDLLKGIVYCMLEDAVSETSGFTREMMNLRTIQNYYLALKAPILRESRGYRGETVTLSTHPLLKGKSPKVKALLSTALDNAQPTMRSYCGVFDGAIKDWFQAHIYSLTTRNTVDIDSIGDQPFAIFLITRDYEKSDFLIAGLFIDWIYKKMLRKAESKECTRPLHFLLDEFGNIPKIKDFENKIATARSRDIWFHLVVQSYKQLEAVYGDVYSVIIRDNCNAQIFLGAQNYATKVVFSQECGKHNIPRLESRLTAENNSVWEVPLIPVSDLDLIKPGHMYIKRLSMPIVTSQYIRSYLCAQYGFFKDFEGANGLVEHTPYAIVSFSDKRFTYSNLDTYK